MADQVFDIIDFEQERAERARQSRLERKRAARRRRIIKRRIKAGITFFGIFLLMLVASFFIKSFAWKNDRLARLQEVPMAKGEVTVDWDDVSVQLLTPNEYSRPQLAIDEVKGIVIHYTGNPGTTAQQNRDFFESLATTHETSVSSHFVVGLEGEIIQCVPLNERAYASNHRNCDTISIECCTPDSTGEFNKETYSAVISLTSRLMKMYHLETDDVIRHYDVTGKRCPKYFVDNEKEWEQFKYDLSIATEG